MNHSKFIEESVLRLGENFVARKIETTASWEYLNLEPHLLHEIKHLVDWLKANPESKDDFYSAFFIGSAGSGKKAVAALLAKESGKELLYFKLPSLINKYIGETEKNLVKIFSHVAPKDFILFFDEADALFGKRTSVKDSHDRYANQEVSYLLQLIENYHGLVILATARKKDLDEAFLRRLRMVIDFPPRK